MAIAAIARRRKLLSDDVIISLVDSSWEILDLSGSDVSDSGLLIVANMCKSLRAVDISRCNKITESGVSELVHHCHLLETLRCGGCPTSESTARRCVGILKPRLNDVEGDSWEELDIMEIGHGAQALRWLVWPKIDAKTMDILSTECPRIIVNPKPSLFGYRGTEVPREALPDAALDDPVVKDIDPKTWSVSGFTPRTITSHLSNHAELSIAEKLRLSFAERDTWSVSGFTPSTITSHLSNHAELSIAEKFRLAFVERDTRLAPKRAKNARQHQRRAEREWAMSSTSAKALALAALKGSKTRHGRS